MIPVEEALARLFALIAPLEVEEVPLRAAAGRVLREAQTAARAQPPFAASAMDGYALRRADARPGARLRVVAEAAAGRAAAQPLPPGAAIRIFTGAPLPQGADLVVIQENTRREGDDVIIETAPGPSDADHIRPAGGDFAQGARFDAPRRLGAQDIALLAAMNCTPLPVTRRPEVAIIATGDELVSPGQVPGPDQIVASNSYGLAALVEGEGARARLLPIARDRMESLAAVLDLARDADLIVTIGGASVGDHDLVGRAAADAGMEQAFYKVAMRPGKPLMAGRLHGVPMIGLPGNPVSALVCGHVFLRPVLRAMLGLPAQPLPLAQAPLAAPVGANGPRAHYMRARLQNGAIAPFDRQDSSLLTVLAQADALLLRPPQAPAATAGELVPYLPLGAHHL